MKPRLTLVFAILILGPLSVIGWLGVRIVHDEQEAVESKIIELLATRLDDVAQTISRVCERKERALRQLLEKVPLPAEAATIRKLVNSQSGIRQIFILDANGDLTHPPVHAQRNQAEEDFLTRTKRIFEAKERFFRAKDESGAPQKAQSSLRARQASISTARKDQGWYTYYFGNSDHFIFWLHDTEGNVIGFDLDRLALLAEIIGELPETNPRDSRLQHDSIQLVNAGGDPVYVFGQYEPLPSESPAVSRELEAPLGAWRLRYYVARDAIRADLSESALWGTLLSLSGLVLAVFGLALYFFRESGREAREARQRVTFVNQVSHELKTPLTNIRMYAELLEEEIDEEETKQRSHLEVIVSESERLSRLIANVLSFARRERNKLTVRPAPAGLKEAIIGIVEQFRPGLESAGFEIATDLAEEGRATFDADALGQILGNLLGNVEKYAKKGKRVEIASTRHGDQIAITVADRGPGIPAKSREKIFKPFYRLSHKVAEGVSGTGIGLSISRELARLHGGDLRLVDTQSGTCFELTMHAPLVKGEDAK